MAAVTRHFVTVAGRVGRRQVHFRRAGEGPALLLLHQSPQSSRELGPLLASWGEQFTCLAPDTPGYGCSDPLGIATASLDDFADAVVEFLDALGVRRAAAYGFHTGGMIAIALGHRHPARITAVACNGLLVLDDLERGPMLRDYLPPLVPRWDGGHLAWLWARNREQAVFFPWHWPALARRMDFSMPGPDYQQQALLEFLRAGDAYHIAYRGAFEFDGPAALRGMQVPTLVTASPLDPLHAHLPRIGPVAAGVRVTAASSADQALDLSRAHVAAFPGSPPDALTPGADVGSPRQVVATPVGAVHVRAERGSAGADALPLLLLHGPGGSSAAFAGELTALAATRTVIAVDLPGHGESEPLVHPGLGRIASATAAVSAVLDALALPRVRIEGRDWGARLALAVAAALPGRVGAVVARDLPRPDADGVAALRAAFAPDAADWHGGHLLRYWHTVRDGRLFSPWCQRDRSAIRWVEPDLDPRGIQQDVTELMKSAGHWQELWAELLERDADADRAVLAARGVSVELRAAAGEPEPPAGETPARRA